MNSATTSQRVGGVCVVLKAFLTPCVCGQKRERAGTERARNTPLSPPDLRIYAAPPLRRKRAPAPTSAFSIYTCVCKIASHALMCECTHIHYIYTMVWMCVGDTQKVGRSTNLRRTSKTVMDLSRVRIRSNTHARSRIGRPYSAHTHTHNTHVYIASLHTQRTIILLLYNKRERVCICVWWYTVRERRGG